MCVCVCSFHPVQPLIIEQVTNMATEKKNLHKTYAVLNSKEAGYYEHNGRYLKFSSQTNCLRTLHFSTNFDTTQSVKWTAQNSNFK
jgi:hypothetical protein